MMRVDEPNDIGVPDMTTGEPPGVKVAAPNVS